MRYTILDGFRGFFLLFMGVVHINELTDVTIGKLNHHYFGWVEDAQGFVFISGLVVGLVYGGIMLRKSEKNMAIAVYRRMLTIYSHQAGLIFIMLFLAMIFYHSASDVPSVLRFYAEEPELSTILSLFLVSGSMHMGILPMYIWFMSITPLVLIAIKRNQVAAVLVMITIFVWFFAQLGLTEIGTQWIEAQFASAGRSVKIGIFFNVLGWQVLFFTGLYAGYKLADGSLNLRFLKHPVYTKAFFLGVGIFVALGVFDRIIFDFWISKDYSAWFLSQISRGNFSLIYLVAFFLDLFLISWLIVAGATCGVRWIETLSSLVQWIFTRRFFVFLGQHSLHVFSYHIFLVYMIAILLEGWTVSELTGSLILIIGVLSLYLPAWLHLKSVTRKRVAA